TPIEGHCTITSKTKRDTLRCSDFRIRISPLTLANELVHVLVMHDVTAVKWRELQERMFLHDLANMLTGLSGWSEEMAAAPSAAAATEILSMAKRLNESLESHRLLLHIETGKWAIQVVPIDFVETANTLHTWFAGHECARQRSLAIHCAAQAGSLETDQQLLLRVLGNLIKNAFEAVPPDTTVTLTISTDERANTVFEVRNPGTMDESVLNQLFRRRFSTKGADRGLGLRAVQVLGEHCLGGIVDCTSDDEHGTVFRFTLPNQPNAAISAEPKRSFISRPG
ncbi:MAG: sensor histidine kinase, partial [Myxococcales bacterium]